MVFLFHSEKNFRTTQRVRIFFCRAKREIFFHILTLGYMTKTLNQIIFFFLHQNQNIFFSNIGNQNIFLEKKHNPPPWKLNDPCLRHSIIPDIGVSANCNIKLWCHPQVTMVLSVIQYKDHCLEIFRQ